MKIISLHSGSISANILIGDSLTDVYNRLPIIRGRIYRGLSDLKEKINLENLLLKLERFKRKE